jgi:hypothetical protein
MRELPSEVPVKGVMFAVKLVSPNHPKLKSKDDDDDDADGCCCFDTCTILINKELHPQYQWAVLWHEIHHALGTGYYELDILNETPLEIVSSTTFSVMRHLGFI